MSSDPRQSPASQPSRERRMAAGICFALVALVWLVFGQAAGFGYVNYDDSENVFASRQETSGLGPGSIAWAFTHTLVGRWAPLTILSHMADWTYFGEKPGGHHLTNVALHALAAVLLFLALRGMTGGLWQSAFAAAVFAVHPLRAEAVSWVSARGDLLAGVFFMLTLVAYRGYARAPGSHARRWGVAACFAAALMCKPTVIMLPFVLLLLDYWPLGRFTKLNDAPVWLGIPRHLVMEKIPLFALSSLACMAAALAQQAAQTPIENLSFWARIGNAFVSCVVYVWQMIWPVRLAAFYPHPGAALAPWKPLLAAAALALVTAAVYAGRRRWPCAFAGWCWYLVMLPPVLGLVEIGEQAHADRYTYLPQIGLYVAVAWGAAGFAAKREGIREIMGLAAGAVLVVLVLLAHNQASQWKDSVTLWSNAVESTGPNVVAEDNLGAALLREGRLDDALVCIRTALQIDPNRPESHLNMGNILARAGQPDAAIAEYQRALELRPHYEGALINLGKAQLDEGHLPEGRAEYELALEINPNNPDALNGLGVALWREGHLDDAIAQFQKALQLDPSHQDAHSNLDQILRQKAQASGANPSRQ